MSKSNARHAILPHFTDDKYKDMWIIRTSECKGGKKCPQETISLSTCVYKVSLHFDMSSVY